MIWTMQDLSATKRAPTGMNKEVSRKNIKNLLRQTRILRKAGNKSTKIYGEVKKMKKSLRRIVQRTCGRDTLALFGLKKIYAHMEQKNMNTDNTKKTSEVSFFLQSAKVVPTIYFVTGLFIIALDVGSHRWAGFFSGFMASMIPSIAGTAAYSPQPDNARLILSLAWFLIPVYAVILCIYDRGKSFQWEYASKKKVGMVLALIGGLSIVVFMATHTPTLSTGTIGMSSRFYYRMISSNISLLLLETAFVLAFASALYVALWLPIESFRRKFKGENS